MDNYTHYAWNYTDTKINNTLLLFLLRIANCGHPEMLFSLRNDCELWPVPKVVGTDDLIPVEGTTVTFSCPSGFKLIGPHTSTCRENGIWEPDPSGLICNISSLEGNNSV